METKIKFNKTAEDIKAVCDDVAAMLIRKNESYGDSALNPVRIFSKAPTNEQLNVRLDDKVNRILNGNGDHFGEEVEMDIIGYLILKEIDRRRAKANGGIRAYTAEVGEGSEFLKVDQSPCPSDSLDPVIAHRKARRGE